MLGVHLAPRGGAVARRGGAVAQGVLRGRRDDGDVDPPSHTRRRFGVGNVEDRLLAWAVPSVRSLLKGNRAPTGVRPPNEPTAEGVVPPVALYNGMLCIDVAAVVSTTTGRTSEGGHTPDPIAQPALRRTCASLAPSFRI